jgi:hypothetical protein
MGSIPKYVIFMIGAGCRPEAPVAERGPVGFSDGGNRRGWFRGVLGPRAVSCAEWNHINGDAYTETVLIENRPYLMVHYQHVAKPRSLLAFYSSLREMRGRA